MTDNELRQIIKKRLIECRTERCVTQKEVGLAVGKSSTAVASWEQGLSLPDLVTIYKLSVFYNKSLDFLFGLED